MQAQTAAAYKSKQLVKSANTYNLRILQLLFLLVRDRRISRKYNESKIKILLCFYGVRQRSAFMDIDKIKSKKRIFESISQKNILLLHGLALNDIDQEPLARVHSVQGVTLNSGAF